MNHIKNNRRHIVLNIMLGIFLALLIAELIYQHPRYDKLVTEGVFDIITRDKNYLGKGLTKVFVKYEPNPWGTSLGDFSFPITTCMIRAGAGNETRTAFLKDTVYEIGVWWRGRLIEVRNSHYLGSLNVEKKYPTFFNVLFMPKTEYTFSELNKACGLLNVEITGHIYNQKNGEYILYGKTTLSLFIFYPYTRIITSSILFLIISLKVYWRKE